MSKRILLIPPSLNHRIVSDQAIINSAAALLRSRGYRVYMVSWYRAGRVNIPSYVRIIWLPSPANIRPWIFRLVIRAFKQVVWLPTDTLDGLYNPTYIHSIAQAFYHAQHGRQLFCTGFSFRDMPDEKHHNPFHQLNSVFFAARDRISQQHFERYSGQKAHLCADIAYCLESRPLPPALNTSLQALKARCRYVIAVNISSHYIRATGQSPQTLAAALMPLLSENTGLVWIPSDFRGGSNSDPLCHQRILSCFSEQQRSQMMVIDDMLHPAVVKSLLGQVDSVLTGRMHLLILALSEGTVPFAISYHDKFRIELESWGLGEHLLSDGSQLSTAISRFLANPTPAAAGRLADKQRLALTAYEGL